MHIRNEWTKPDVSSKTWWYGHWDEKTIDWWWGEGDENSSLIMNDFLLLLAQVAKITLVMLGLQNHLPLHCSIVHLRRNHMPIDGNAHTLCS